MHDASVQSFDRAIGLLKRIAFAHRDGARLSDLVQASGLPQPTVHRLLKQLITSGLVAQGRHKRYRLGHFAYELGLAVSAHHELKETARPRLEDIAMFTGDTAFLSVRSDKDSFCLDQAKGSFPVEALPVKVGHRRPLGVDGGGLALLSYLPPSERERIIDKIAPRLGGYGGLTVDILRHLIADTRPNGFSTISNYVVPGVTCIGHPVFRSRGVVVAALSVSSTTERMTGQGKWAILAWLSEEPRALQARLREAQ